jgi:hypothetical protein
MPTSAVPDPEQPISRDVLLDVRLGQAKDIEGEPESVLRPGDAFFEPEGARIARFDAQDAGVQDAGVTFLAYFLLGPGQEPEIRFPEDH